MSVCTGCLFDYLWKDEVTTCPKECEGCVFIDGKPSKFTPKSKTNADRIRAMTDEELADFISTCGCPDHARDCRASCKDCTKEWLQQPAKEDNDEN